MVKFLGTQITKVEAKKIKIKSKVEKIDFRFKTKIENIEAVDKPKGEGDKKEQAVSVDYSLTADYVSDGKVLASIVFNGEAVFAYPEDTAKEVVKEFKKSKKVEKTIYAIVEKFGFEQCIIETITLSKILKLPTPIPFSEIFKKQQTDK